MFGLYIGSFYYKDTRTPTERITDEIIENINTHPNDWVKTTALQIEADDEAAKIELLKKDTSANGKFLLFLKVNKDLGLPGLSMYRGMNFDDINYSYYENKKCNIRLKFSKPEPAYYTQYYYVYVYRDGKLLFILYKNETDDLRHAVYTQLIKPEADRFSKQERIEQIKNDSITNSELKKVTICN